MYGDGLRFTRTSTIAIVGAGRLGSSLALALKRSDYRLAAVSSRDATHRSWLSTRLPGVAVVETPREAASRAEIVFITVGDASVAAVASAIPWSPRQAAVHCAGVLPVTALDAASKAGAAVGGFHPLQTFPTFDGVGRFTGVGIAIESPDRSLAIWMRGIADAFHSHSFEITAAQRQAYHASAVMACGLLAGLAGLAAEMWWQLGVSREQALKYLAPLIKSTADAIGEFGIPAALTGPYVRGDVETVARHVEVTTRQSNEVGLTYASLALSALHLMAEQGALSAEAKSGIQRVLRQSMASNYEKLDLTT
jgi:predicted short-subunit dehydrogenase-like oxidoreductase (DUF2520 family)